MGTAGGAAGVRVDNGGCPVTIIRLCCREFIDGSNKQSQGIERTRAWQEHQDNASFLELNKAKGMIRNLDMC
ncbi:hypothetical protein ZWY2020_005602 [Hordeum vulgare]|nr:hypothetical protein ZWY2020_005602 [Hordeum vulgare]